MNDNEEPLKTDADCAVCLQKCNHPTQLPCGHIFCFLCVKGIAFQSKKCAMCRAEIPQNYLDSPKLLESTSLEELNTNETANVYQWFYEGRNGWWKYDERSNIELETAFSADDPVCTLLLAGTLYNIDFQSMTQVRRSDQTRRRRVHRDTPQFPSKGIAGIKTDNANTRQPKSGDESSDIEIIEVDNETIEITDTESEDNNVLLAHNEDPENEVSHITESMSTINIEESNISLNPEDS